ncbi:MAG: MerR family transcriptional regulator [Chloroflexi bacterium]|nr:MerR family transcriptional regulator [Chloroflexota bacterium]
MDEDAGYTIDEMASAVDVPVRTVRYYLAEGLLPGPGKRGKGALYSGAHVQRLRLIRRLVARHVPLSDIGTQLASLDDDDVRRLLAQEERQATQLVAEAASSSPRDYVATLLRQADVVGDAPRARAAYSLAAPVAPQPPRPETWQRWEVLPGLELLVRRDLAGTHRRLIERLIALARGHDPPDDQ